MTDVTPLRRCPKCGVQRQLEDFYRDRDPRRPKRRPCRHCHRAYLVARVRRQTEYVQKIKLERGCADCGLKTDIPEVYDFDHRPGVEKIGDIARLRLGDMRILIAEIAKCDVVCANCHRIRTVKRHDHGMPFGYNYPDAVDARPDDEPPMLFDIPA